ncbi:MAG: hypothetical protein II037_06210, partial [Bacteroidales bacterium]|nr:hypothetical protein [Bacteroidales bacterium]
IYISALDRTDEKDLMRGLKSASGYLRRELGSRLGLRYTPIPDAHHYLILHGRYVCTARSPKCANCGISAYCAFYQQNTNIG